MDSSLNNGIYEPKIVHDVQPETIIKSIKHTSIKKNIVESDHRTPKRKSDISHLNTLKKKKKYETALAAIFPENDHSYSLYAQDYADGYMKKMRERLDPESFDVAIKLLVAFGDVDDNNINLLYKQITELFTTKNEDLIYEFLGFLLPGQALLMGKLTDYLELTRIKDFTRKLQVCMKKQQTKIVDNLYYLSKNENITLSEVHTTMLPLLKSNPILVDCFFQLIPTERPPESFFSDDNWEDLDIDQSINCGIDYEEIIPSDSEDQIQLNICHCTCHKLGDITHCRSCGLKFFKGRIYFDTSEGLKLAKINFEGADPSIVQSKFDKTDVNITVKQKNRRSLIKNNSPGSAEDIKGSTGTESEEDLIEVKPKKRQKSKVVQSLKLKFKKEENTKCKYQETCNEIGKSIVHVTNEELNSSEMVFFCIPKTKVESCTKIVPKKKIKLDDKEIVTKECTINNQIRSKTLSSNILNLAVHEKNIEMNVNETLVVNSDYDTSKEIISKKNVIPQDMSIKNVPELYCISDDKKPKEIQIELINKPSEIISNIEPIDPDESDKNMYNKECIKGSDTRNFSYKKQFNNKNTLTKSTGDSDFITSNISDKTEIHETILDENLTINNEFIEISNCSKSTNKTNKSLIDGDLTIKNKIVERTDSVISTHGINKSLIDENIIIKSQTIESLPECYLNIKKQDKNETEKQLINKWTIDEDKIILQTCKRVEDIEVLLETINRRIPQRSVSEIQERFTTLMTLLEQMIDVKQN